MNIVNANSPAFRPIKQTFHTPSPIFRNRGGPRGATPVSVIRVGGFPEDRTGGEIHKHGGALWWGVSESEESHQYSTGRGFTKPYAGFDLDPPSLELDPDEVDPVDTHVLPDLLDDRHLPADRVDADELIEVGLAYLAIDQHAQAADAFERAARFATDPDRVQEAWVNKGIAHAELEEWDAAVGAHREALRVASDAFLSEAHTNLAYAFWEWGEDEKAFHHAEEAVRANPRLGYAWYNLGFFERERGREDLALECLDAAVRLGFRNAVVHEERAAALEALGREGEAAEAEERVSDHRERAERRLLE